MAYAYSDLNPDDQMFRSYDGLYPLDYCQLVKLTNARDGDIDECIVRVVEDKCYGGEPIVEFYLPSGYFVSCYYISTLLGHTGGALGLDGWNSSYVIDDRDLVDIMNDIRLTVEM